MSHTPFNTPHTPSAIDPTKRNRGLKVETDMDDNNFPVPATPKSQRRSKKVDYAALATGVSSQPAPPRNKREDDRHAAEAMLAQHKAITTVMAQRERLLREMMMLHQETSLIDYDGMHQKVSQSLAEYETKRNFAPKFDIPQDELEHWEQVAEDDESEGDEPALPVRVPLPAPTTSVTIPRPEGFALAPPPIKEEIDKNLNVSITLPAIQLDLSGVNQMDMVRESASPMPGHSVSPRGVPPARRPMVIQRVPSGIMKEREDRAQQDGFILARVAALKAQGLWAGDRLPKAPEAPRTKNHWDYLLEEMMWLANDVIEERKWKISLAKKISRAVLRYWEIQATKGDRDKKSLELTLKKIASNISKDIKKFWSNIEKIVKYKQDMKAESKKKEMMDRKLEMLVGQTEKFSDMLAKNLANSDVAPQAQAPEAQVVGPEQPQAPAPAPTAEQQTTAADESHPPQTEDEAGINTDALAGLAKGSGDSGDDSDDDDDDETRQQRTRAEEIIKKRRKNDDEPKMSAINAIATQAMESMPTGTTLATTNVRTRPPFLLKGTLREYQHVGLDWLVSLYNKKLNGILADEMGLGKTIQTISLLAHLACERGIWGPHLIIVPTSVMLNWECEFKKWCPAFKILTYYGSAKERKIKRQGWTRTNAFHVCITSYQLAVQDHLAFRRKKWKYLILDEAHTIKNFKSVRWQTLINFNSKRRLLLTGTPLQNNLMELWSLMHFLMPTVFESHAEFKEWFSNPMNDMVAYDNVNNDIISRLHSVLRPFLLRRLKSAVEQQMPSKHEHVVPVTLSKRQRMLYEEYMQRSDTRSIMEGGNFLSMINVLMQLRKVCNHPDLFEEHPILSPFDCMPLDGVYSMPINGHTAYYGATWYPSCVVGCVGSALGGSVLSMATETINAIDKLKQNGSVMDALMLDIRFLNLCLVENQLYNDFWAEREANRLAQNERVINMSVVTDMGYEMTSSRAYPGQRNVLLAANSTVRSSLFGTHFNPNDDPELVNRVLAFRSAVVQHHNYISKIKSSKYRAPMYSNGLVRVLTTPTVSDVNHITMRQPDTFLENNRLKYLDVPDCMLELVPNMTKRYDQNRSLLDDFCFLRPYARAMVPKLHVSHLNHHLNAVTENVNQAVMKHHSIEPDLLHDAAIRRSLYFPDRNLLQYDCGKLQILDSLLRQLKTGGHRVLIFTQMSRMLDILEKFLTYHGHVYLRLDGATKPEARQALMERFNGDPKVFCFILSTRSGGIGVNLTGADTVVFYDSDWNPAMDAQAQDRCHRIGQTRDVHVYRLVSSSTIEENIFIKATQKRYLDQLVITKGNFTTEFFSQKNIRDLFDNGRGAGAPPATPVEINEQDVGKALAAVEDEDDAAAAINLEREMKVTNALDTAENAEMTAEEAIKAVADQMDDAIPVDAAGQGQSNPAGAQPAPDAIESQLTPIQRLALKFMEIVDPIQPEDEGDDKGDEPDKEKDMEMDVNELMRMREEEEAESDDDDDLLFYEVEPTSAAANVGMTSSAKALRDKAYDDMQSYYESLPVVTSAVTPMQPRAQSIGVKVYTPPTDEVEDEYGPLSEEYRDVVEDTIRQRKSAAKKKTKKKRKNIENELGAEWNPPTETKREARKRELYFGEESEYYTDDEANFSRKRRNAPSATAPSPIVTTSAVHEQVVWTPIQDNILRDIIQEFGQAWDLAADSVNNLHVWGGSRKVSADDCKQRYNTVLSMGSSRPKQDYVLPPFQMALFKQAYELQLRNRNQRPPDTSGKPSMQCHESHQKAVKAAEDAEAAEFSAINIQSGTVLAPLFLADYKTRKEQQALLAQQKQQQGVGQPQGAAVQQVAQPMQQQQQQAPQQVPMQPHPQAVVAQPHPVPQQQQQQHPQAPQQGQYPQQQVGYRTSPNAMVQQRPAVVAQMQPGARPVPAPVPVPNGSPQDLVLANALLNRHPASKPEVERIMSNADLGPDMRAQAIKGVFNRYNAQAQALAQAQSLSQGQPQPQGQTVAYNAQVARGPHVTKPQGRGAPHPPAGPQ